MLPAKISLWKKEYSEKKKTYRWYRYNSVFKSSDKDSLMKASRLVRFGWIPYPDVSRVNDKTVPLDIAYFDIDTKPLDEAVRSACPISNHIPSDWYDRLSKSQREPTKDKFVIEPIEDLTEAVEKRVLNKCIEAYKRGEKIPPFMIKEVMKALF